MTTHRTLYVYVEGVEPVDFSKLDETDPLLEQLRALATHRFSSESLVLSPTPEITDIMFRLNQAEREARPNKAEEALLTHAWKAVWSFRSLTPAARSGFQGAKITYIWQLVKFTESQLNVHQVGPARKQMLARDLADLGLRFGMNAEVERNLEAIMAAKPPGITWPAPQR